MNFADPSGHSIWSSIKNGVGKAVNAVKNVATNVTNAIKSTVSTVTNAVKNTVSTIKNAFAPKPSAPTHRYTSPPTPAWNAGQTQTNIFHGAAQTPAQNPAYTVKTIDGKPTLVPAHFDNPTAAATSFVKERGCDPSKAKAAKQNEEGWFTSLSKNVGKWWQENQQAITVGVTGIAIGMAIATVLSAGAAAPLLAATIATTLGTTAATGATLATLALAGVATAGGISIATGVMSIGSTIPSENNVLKLVINSPTFQEVQGGSILVSTLGTATLAPYAQMGQQAKQEQAATNNTKPAAGQVSEGGSKTYQYNMVENPGPLAELQGQPAKNFFSGKYNTEVLKEDKIYYRAGQEGKPLGQWFTSKPAESVAKVRIDTAVKSQWIDPVSGELTGTSIIDTNYAIKIPAGTTVYTGPVGNQGGVYLGGSEMMQTFIETPWKLKNIEVVGQTPLK